MSSAAELEERAGAAAAVLQRAQRDPVWFCLQVLGEPYLFTYQRRILEALRDHTRVTVRSANGVGKTYTAALAVLWFLAAHSDSRVITTATTWPQVEKLLWHELRQVYGRARFPLGGQLNLVEWKLDDGRYALGLSTAPHNLESFQGHHAPNILTVYDEASGIPQPVFDAGEGYMTTEGAVGAVAGAKQLLIGNPTRPGGQFYMSHHGQRNIYHAIHVSAFDAIEEVESGSVPPNVAMHLPSRTFIEGRAKAWGTDSPIYHVRVLGNFPRSSGNTVIPLGAVEDAQARELIASARTMPITIGVDVARFGDDESVIATRIGPRLRIRHKHTGQALPVLQGAIIGEAKRYVDVAVTIVIDDAGVGGGLTDYLRAYVHEHGLGWTVVAFNGAERALEIDARTGEPAYPNRRSESWFAMSAVLPDLDLDPDDMLAGDLSSPTYTFNGLGQRVVEPKADTKKRLGRSPDTGDATILACAVRQPAHAMAVLMPRAGQTEAPGTRQPPPMQGILREQW